MTAAALPSKDLSSLIGRIYDCALDPAMWEPALEAIKGQLRCQSGQLFLNDLRQHRCLIEKNVGVDSSWLQAQYQYLPCIHAQMETWHDGGHSIDESLVLSRDLSPAMLASSPYFQEWNRPQGFVDVMETTLMWSPTRWSGLCFRRHERMGAFGEHETQWMRLLAPHLRRAVTISNVLDAKTVETARMAETLDVLKLGVVLTNAESRILHLNRAAAEMMQRCGLLRDKGGFLRAEGAASAEIKTAIQCAARNESGIGKTGLAVRLTDDRAQPVVAHVLPLANGEVRTRIEPEAVAAVFINAPMEEACCAKALTAAYKLTPAETRVLSPILAGKTVPEAADEAGVAVTTARTHLNNIFAKAGVSRQSELIKLAASLAPATL